MTEETNRYAVTHSRPKITDARVYSVGPIADSIRPAIMHHQPSAADLREYVEQNNISMSIRRGDKWEHYLGNAYSRIHLALHSATQPEVRDLLCVAGCLELGDIEDAEISILKDVLSSLSNNGAGADARAGFISEQACADNQLVKWAKECLHDHVCWDDAVCTAVISLINSEIQSNADDCKDLQEFQSFISDFTIELGIQISEQLPAALTYRPETEELRTEDLMVIRRRLASAEDADEALAAAWEWCTDERGRHDVKCVALAAIILDEAGFNSIKETTEDIAALDYYRQVHSDMLEDIGCQ